MALPEHYSLRSLSREEFWPLCQPISIRLFEEESLIFRIRDAMSPQELEQMIQLGSRLGDPFRLYLGLYYKEEFIGWSWGFQESSETYYMCNSAVTQEHRRKGLYSYMIQEVLSEVTKKGFQKIYSRHMATNNAVIIPKLKAGFMLTHFELSDTFGVLIHLTYLTNSTRRKVLEFRCGEKRPDEQINALLGLTK